MSIHLFMIEAMRIIDAEKIKRVQIEAKKLIVERGYHGASISEIAKQAQVSDGYLYRHYQNKVDLVTTIFETQLKDFHDFVFHLLDTKDTVRDITEGVISFLFDLYEKDPIAISFANSLVYDFEFQYPESRAQAIDKIIQQILLLGTSTKEFSLKIRAIDILTTIFTIPVKFIDYHSKGHYRSSEEQVKVTMDKQEEVQLLLNICMNALK